MEKVATTTPNKNELLTFLSPSRSKLRPFLALLALKNYILHKNKYFIGNNPSITWFSEQLSRAGISNNYWGIRRNLRLMAEFGILKEQKVIRPALNPVKGHNRITRLEFSEFYLAEEFFYPLQEVLRHIFQTKSLSSLFKPANLKAWTNKRGFLGTTKNQQISK